MSQVSVQSNPMREIRVGKVVINIGLGKSGEAIERGKKVLEQVTGQKPSQTKAKRSVRDFGIHKGEPIGVVVTVRGGRTGPLIEKLLTAREKKVPESAFDPRGSVSFGIKEHIEIPGIRYDPEIGILGMNVSILLERPGFRVSRRSRRASKVGRGHRVSRDEAVQFFKEKFGVAVV
ncbi:MAG TPA: 50S ribosomal protein L5, partial [Nitrososphaerales archaeon]|nr:50S ribosomal protein L5 [Nitrososphaerales archaeon]